MSRTIEPTRLKREMIGFKLEGTYFVAEIYYPFRPMGLMLWDCPPRTWLTQTLVGNTNEILANWNPVPADIFMMAKSFEQLNRLLEEGIEPPGWPDFDAAYPGNRIRVVLVNDEGKPVGNPVRVAMWGFAVH